MFNTFKKSVALVLALVFMMSLVPFGVMAEVADGNDMSVASETEGLATVQVPFINYTSHRGDRPAQAGSTNANKYISTGSSWKGTLQVDLSEYEEIIRNPGTTVEFRTVTGNSYSTGLCYDFKFVILPDSLDNVDYKALTFTEAKALGYWNTDRDVLFARSDATELKGTGHTVSGEADKDALVSALNQSSTNGLVTLAALPGDSGSTSAIQVGNADSGLFITYDPSESDDEAYFAEIEGEFDWDKLTSDSKDAVENKLPTYYAGATVTWSSADGVVESDGTIIPQAGGDVSASITAAVDYKGYCFEKEFEITVVGEEPIVVQVPFVNYSSHRGDRPDETGSTNAQKYISAGASWKGTAQVDLSAYEEILRTPHASVEFSTVAGNSYSTGKCYDFKVILNPDIVDNSSYKALTYKKAAALGLWDETGKAILFARSDATEIKGTGKTVSGTADKDALIAALDGGYTNGLVTLGFIPGASGSTSAIQVGNAASGLYISYYPSELDSAKYLDSYKDEFVWDNLTADSAADVENDLPTYFRGAKVTWSSQEGLVNSDGTINSSREEALTGKLNAVLTYGDASFEKSFDVTLAKIMPVVIKVASTSKDVCQVSVKHPDDYFAPSSSTFYPTSGAMYNVPTSGRGDVHAFVRINLSDYVKYIEAATNVTFTLVNRNSSTFDRAMVTVLGDGHDDWLFGDSSGLTYNKAINSGMYTDPGYGVFYGGHIPSKNTAPKPMESPELTEAIKNAVAVNPDEGLVTFRVSSSYWEGISFQLASTAGYPYVEITYYEDDVMTDEELAQAKKDKLLWSRITKQDIDNVVADLELPEKWYGKDVIWASSNEAVISSSGEVTVGTEAKEVTLTATIDGATNEFKVTVPASKIAVKSDYTHKKSATKASGYTDGSNLNYSAAHIYANEDIEGTFDIVIATYKNGTLSNVTMKEDVVIKEGYICIPSDYHYAFGGNVETKVMIFDEVGGLNPLVEAR